MSAKGSGATAPFYDAIDKMMAGERPWDAKWLQHAASQFPQNEQIADALEIALMPGDEIRKFFACRHKRDQISSDFRKHPENMELRVQLAAADRDLAEAEAALPV
ncbi:MAG TPA: hypothetical protein VLE93_00680 [Candidatus Saccharimonadales bacterium]|nr:hypothetical protein [Candidatus Saccharimonadales bacterium]